jgi:hypothetical protein
LLGLAARISLCVIAAVVLGFGATWALLDSIAARSAIQNGAWDTNLAVGGAGSGPYLRAAVALTGLFALNRSETIYYSARRDSGGAALDGKCSYRIEGRDPDARWWSITSYAADNFLIPNSANRYSVSQSNAERSLDGSFVIRASVAPESGNWIPTAREGFTLTLRLYNPGVAVSEGPGDVELPRILKEACS